MDSDFYRKSFLVALVLLLGTALFQMLTPFWGALSWGLCLAFLLQPLQRWLTRQFRGRDSLAAGLLTGLTPIVVLLPLTSLGLVFAQQVRQLVELLRSIDFKASANWLTQLEQYSWIARALAFVREHSVVSTADVQGWLVSGAQSLLQSLANAGGSVV
jgi:predicted PurR-regulated permease PerM